MNEAIAASFSRGGICSASTWRIVSSMISQRSRKSVSRISSLEAK